MLILGLRAAAVAAVSIGLVSNVSADTIYDSFDYPLTTSPVEQTGDLGFDDSYTGAVAGSNPFGVVNGLSFTDSNGSVLETAGNAIQRPIRNGRDSVNADVGTAAATLTGDGSTMWFSFLYQRSADTIDTSVLLGSAGQNADGGHNLASVGNAVGVVIEDLTGPPVLNAPFIAAVYDNSDTRLTSSGNSLAITGETPTGETQFIVGQVNWNPDGTNDELFVYNIDDLSVAPSTATALASTAFDFTAAQQDSLSILSINDTQTVVVDEIRFGTTFASVAPIATAVPEPSSVALFGLLSCVVALRRRR